MDIEQKPTLIYYKARGKAQVIRCVLFQVGADFQQVFVSYSGDIDPNIASKYRIDLKKLPYFIHNGLVIHGLFPIIKYICLAFKRYDLLGCNLQDSIEIAQILVKEERMHGSMLAVMFNGLKQVQRSGTGADGIKRLARKMIEMAFANHQVDHIIRRFSQNGKGYLFKYLTVIDFLYYDKCFYGTRSITCDEPEAKPAIEYLFFFENTEFHRKYGGRLNEYKVFFPGEKDTINFMKNYWKGSLSDFAE